MIGDGLFSRRAYDVGDHITDYNGDLITVVEGNCRDESGHGGYMKPNKWIVLIIV